MKIEEKQETMRGISSQYCLLHGIRMAANLSAAISCSFSRAPRRQPSSLEHGSLIVLRNGKQWGCTLTLGTALATVSVSTCLSFCESVPMPLLEKPLDFISHLGALDCFSLCNWPKVTEEIYSRTGK